MKTLRFIRVTLRRMLFVSVPAATSILALIAGWVLREAMSHLVVFI